MKIALACKSVLLKRALEIFLKSHIVPIKQADFVICDCEASYDKPIFHPKNDVSFPFSRANLMMSLEDFYKKNLKTIESNKELHVEASQSLDFLKLESKIKAITKRYEEELLEAIKEHYEK